MGFKVFEVDLGGGKWKELKSLGNRALFLGHYSSVSVEASNSRDVDLIAFTLLIVILINIGQFLVEEAGIWASTTC